MSRPVRCLAAIAGLHLLIVLEAGASVPDGPPPPLAQAWTLSSWTLVPLLLAAVLYAAGARRMRAKSHAAGDIARRGFAFAGGMLVLGSVLVWPVDAYAGYLASAHVAQHMALLALAPPLLVAAQPGAVWHAALPVPAAHVARRLLQPLHASAVSALGLATLAHVATMWVWHVPGAIAMSLESEWVHRWMLASVLCAGLWFWAAVLHRLRTQDGGVGGACVALVTAMMLMGFLGALLTFSPRLLYPAYTDRALMAGADALHDQQLAGLLMWVPGGLPYLLVGLLLVIALLRGLPSTGADGRAA